MGRGGRAEQDKARTTEAGGAKLRGAKPGEGGQAAGEARPAPPDDLATIRVTTYFAEGRREPLFRGRAFRHGEEVGGCWASTAGGALAGVEAMLRDELAVGSARHSLRRGTHVSGDAKTSR